jgi:hypothetical protein
MRHAEHICIRVTLRRREFEARHFEQLTIRVAKVDRIHETAVDVIGVLDAALFEPRCNLSIRSTRDVVGNMMKVAVKKSYKQGCRPTQRAPDPWESTRTVVVGFRLFYWLEAGSGKMALLES